MLHIDAAASCPDLLCTLPPILRFLLCFSITQELQDAQSPELGLTCYQLATTYYAQDLLQDAGALTQRAAVLLQQHYPADHDLLLLCKHRLGMICAAGTDRAAGKKLLIESKERYLKQGEEHPLAAEAEVGLDIIR